MFYLLGVTCSLLVVRSYLQLFCVMCSLSFAPYIGYLLFVICLRNLLSGPCRCYRGHWLLVICYLLCAICNMVCVICYLLCVICYVLFVSTVYIFIVACCIPS